MVFFHQFGVFPVTPPPFLARVLGFFWPWAARVARARVLGFFWPWAARVPLGPGPPPPGTPLARRRHIAFFSSISQSRAVNSCMSAIFDHSYYVSVTSRPHFSLVFWVFLPFLVRDLGYFGPLAAGVPWGQ